MTLVLLHPVGLDHGCWQLTGLKGETPDYPGHGNRAFPRGGFTLESVADEIAAAFDGLLDLVGVSMGGAVAQHIAVRHPERVHSMVLAASGAGRTEVQRAVADKALNTRVEETRRLGMAGTLDSTLERWFSQAALADDDHPGVTYARHRWLANSPESVAATWRALGRHALRDQLASVTVPVTVLGGTRDVSATVPVVTDLQSLLPNSRLELIDGPHMLHLEQPMDFADAVRSHLEWAANSARIAAT